MDRKFAKETDSQSSKEQSHSAMYHELASSEHETASLDLKSGNMEPYLRLQPLKTEDETDSASATATSPPSTPSPTHHGSPAYQPQVAIKILVSNSASGFIIGRSGRTINELQEKSKARIKLSQGGDYYPGTADRVCLIQGSLTNANAAVELILSKLYEIQSLQHLPSQSITDDTSNTSEQNFKTPFLIRLLIPSSFCGMVIGLGGSNIKSLKEESGLSMIQISQKESERIAGNTASIIASTSERIMTINGIGFLGHVKCIISILSDMALNPELARYVNMTTSYSKMVTAAQNSLAVAATMIYTPSALAPRQNDLVYEQLGQLRLQESPSRQSNLDHQFMLASQPTIPFATTNDAGCFGTLDQGSNLFVGSPQVSYDYNILLSSPDRNSRVLSTMQSSTYQSQSTTHTSQESLFTTTGVPLQMWPPTLSPTQTSSNTSQLFSFDVSSRREAPNRLPVQMTSHGPSTTQIQNAPDSQPVTAQFGVPEALVGSILGKKGKTLTEIQAASNTRIRISQRGEYIPGTKQRVVTITGATSRNVATAQSLISQRLSGGGL